MCFLSHTVIKAGDKRLRESCKLQQNFEARFLRTPEVLHTESSGDRFVFSMERIKDATTIFHADVDGCLERLFAFVLDNLELSQYYYIPAETFINKLSDIDTGRWSWVIEHLKERFSRGVQLPVGPMHGDLTFCNVLCKGKDVWLIDFLDGIVSSPVMDVAKMRQDSYHGWIELFEDAPNREYVDRRIMETFDLPWLRELTLLALLRIDPYAKTESVHNFLRREIPHAYSDLDNGG